MSEKEEVKPLKIKAKKPSLKKQTSKIHKLDLTKEQEDAVQE